jgi:catechol 2,3-dioxygenase-like lactoylglutathione lyase family enzyme
MTVQQPDGIHHIAIMSANMKEQLTFFTQVMGFPLVALFDMHGVPGGKHAFLKMADDSFFSVVELAGIAEIPSTLGITHAGTGAGKCAAGTMQHIPCDWPNRPRVLQIDLLRRTRRPDAGSELCGERG